MSDRSPGPSHDVTGRPTTPRAPASEPAEDQRTLETRRYAVSYAFDDASHGGDWPPVSLISDAVAEMRREGVDIEFLGLTQELNARGELTETTARYAAPSIGVVGRLNCRAGLPASGSPRWQR